MSRLDAPLRASMPHPRITHYVHIDLHGIRVKTRDQFIADGGLTTPEGHGWHPVVAISAEDARGYGEMIRRAWNRS